MIGHADEMDTRDAAAREPLLQSRPRGWVMPLWLAPVALGAVALLLLVHRDATVGLNARAETLRWNGVTLGGWLVMEINPAKADGVHPDMRPNWMFDQIAARSELDCERSHLARARCAHMHTHTCTCTHAHMRTCTHGLIHSRGRSQL